MAVAVARGFLFVSSEEEVRKKNEVDLRDSQNLEVIKLFSLRYFSLSVEIRSFTFQDIPPYNNKFWMHIYLPVWLQKRI